MKALGECSLVTVRYDYERPTTKFLDIVSSPLRGIENPSIKNTKQTLMETQKIWLVIRYVDMIAASGKMKTFLHESGFELSQEEADVMGESSK